MIPPGTSSNTKGQIRLEVVRGGIIKNALVHVSALGPDPGCSCQGTLAKGPAGA